jgi:hypothetical protein
MSRHVITSACVHLRPVSVERIPGHPPVVRYSTAMQPGTVLCHAMRELSDDETLALAEALGMQRIEAE